MIGIVLIAALPFFVGLVWSAILFIEYRRSDPARRMLAWFILCNTGLLFSRLLIVAADVHSFNLIRCLFIFFTLTVFPIGYLYIRRLTSPKTPSKKELWLLAPAVVASGAVVAAYFITSVDWHPIVIFARFLLPMEVILLAVFGQMAARDYRYNIDNYYSDSTEFQQRPMYILLSTYVLFSLVKSLGIAAGYDLNSDITLISIISAVYSFLIFDIAYVGYRTTFNAGSFAIELKRSEPCESSYGNASRISAVMEESKMFLIPGLKITDVAMELGTNRTYLSEYINDRFGMSFSDYINGMRVNYAMDMIKDDPDKDLMDVCYDSGFSSDTAFHRNFKKFAMVTPSTYRDSAREELNHDTP